MRFTLHYRGALKSNAGPKIKHTLRQHFHPQLKMLWSQEPLKHRSELLTSEPKERELCVIEKVGAFTFAPLVTERIKAIASLEITYLRYGPAGSLFCNGGDIDNRLKTLMDALSVPQEGSVKNLKPRDDEEPFFCLLQDDSLVTRVDVRTDQLLELTENTSEVELLIHVKPRITRALLGNLDFQG